MSNEVTMDNIKKALDDRLGDKLGLGADQLQYLGGFLNLFKEGEDLYNSRITAIQSTGKLLDELVGAEGKEGLIGRLGGISEDSFKFFGRLKEGVDATNELTQGLRSFVMTNRDMQKELVTQAALFKKLGVNMSDFTSVIDSARLGFKMTGKEASQLASNIAQIGNATGVGMKEAMSNFSKAQSSMAYSAGKLMENFRALQLTSAQTGVGFDKLTSAFGDSMDTFEGSASKAGSLNAILGRSVFNSIELLGQTEAQRVETIIQGIKRNVNVEALGKNKFQLKAISQGLGLSPDETRRLLTGQMTVDEALAQKQPTDPREKALKKMAELLENSVNPNLDTFGDMIKNMRTAEGQATVAMNTVMRGQVKKLFADQNIAIDSPGEIFETIQQSLRELARRGSLDDVTEKVNAIKSIFTDGSAEISKAEGREAKIEAGKRMFEKLAPELKEILESTPKSPDFAGTESEQAKRGPQALRNIDIQVYRAASDIFKPLRQVLGATSGGLEKPITETITDGTNIILQVGKELFNAVLIQGEAKKR
tara:strand:+ start:213 stop:1823 length:1611 start_codon:yes stop_codon:yes gene_type:complete